MEEKTSGGRPVEAEDFCAFFTRIPISLIEEPEACEFCRYYDDRQGFCVHTDEPPPPPLMR